MPIQGFTRLRKFQIGATTSIGSNVAATRILPWRAPIEVEPARELPDVDMGSLDPILASFNGPQEVTASAEGKAAFDDMPYFWSGLLKGGVTATGGGSAKTWVWQAASLSADAFPYFTAEYGDDVTNDVTIAGGGILDSGEIGFDEDLGAFDLSGDFVFARAQLGGNFTGGLTIDATPNWLYGADTEVFIDTVAASIGTTKLVDDVHSQNTAINGNNDRKRFANGSNTRFELAGYGRGAREGTITIVRAKTAASIAERASLDDEPVPTRYIEIRTTSPEIITGSTPYSQSQRYAAELLTATDGEIGGNSTIEFTYRVKYDATLGYAYRVVVVNTLTGTI
jgi:hypothetical protein